MVFFTGQKEIKEFAQLVSITDSAAATRIRLIKANFSIITGQNEREESTQNTTVTQSAAACASYKIKT